MDVQSRALIHFQKHYRKILVVLSSAIALYLLNKYLRKKMFGGTKPKKPKKRDPIKDFPTIEDIQTFIEDLPFDSIKADNMITLKDLLGELSEFSEDEDWKELISSVHSLYQESPRAVADKEKTK